MSSDHTWVRTCSVRHRFWKPAISQVRILPPRRNFRLRSSVDRAPGFDPGCRRFNSYRGLSIVVGLQPTSAETNMVVRLAPSPAGSDSWECGVNGNTPVLHAGTLGSNPSTSTRNPSGFTFVPIVYWLRRWVFNPENRVRSSVGMQVLRRSLSDLRKPAFSRFARAREGEPTNAK